MSAGVPRRQEQAAALFIRRAVQLLGGARPATLGILEKELTEGCIQPAVCDSQALFLRREAGAGLSRPVARRPVPVVPAPGGMVMQEAERKP